MGLASHWSCVIDTYTYKLQVQQLSQGMSTPTYMLLWGYGTLLTFYRATGPFMGLVGSADVWWTCK